MNRTHMLKTNLQQHIFIDALPTKIWKVLTAPDYIDQYLLDGTVNCQWTEGSPITAVTENEGKVESFCKGNIVQVVPGVLLKYNLREENKENLIAVTYQLLPAENGIELKYYSEGFTDADEDYFFRIKQTQLLLQKIKWLAEYA